MLANASALTGAMPWALLRVIGDGDEDALLDLLDEAIESQLVRERPDLRTGGYEFTHALIRQSLYDDLSAPRRARLHGKIGRAIEEVHADDLEPHLSELAHHFHESGVEGDFAKFVDYSIRAGQRAMKLMAYEEAARLYRRALDALEPRERDTYTEQHLESNTS